LKDSAHLLQGDEIFDIKAKKSKDYHSLIISEKAQLPSNAKKLKNVFNLSDKYFKLAFILPHLTAQEPYV